MTLAEKKAFEKLEKVLFCTSEHVIAQADVGYIITLSVITGFLGRNIPSACISILRDMIDAAWKLRVTYCSQYKRFLEHLQSRHPLVKREGTMTFIGMQPRVGFVQPEGC